MFPLAPENVARLYYRFCQDLPLTILKKLFGLFRGRLIGLRITSDLCFHCLMTSNLNVEFCLKTRQKINAILKRRLKLIAKWGDEYQNKNELFVCLDCEKIHEIRV